MLIIPGNKRNPIVFVPMLESLSGGDALEINLFSVPTLFSTQLSLWSSSHIRIVTAGKTIALTIQTFVGKVMSLLFNTLSRFVIAFLPRSKPILIS